jgi:hypothetical protein
MQIVRSRLPLASDVLSQVEPILRDAKPLPSATSQDHGQLLSRVTVEIRERFRRLLVQSLSASFEGWLLCEVGASAAL